MRMSCALLVGNTKVMSRSHQGHFKVKLAKNIENTHFLAFQAVQWCSHPLERTDGDTDLVGYHFSTHF